MKPICVDKLKINRPYDTKKKHVITLISTFNSRFNWK